jgi:NADPH2:quinone reductase
MKAAYIQEVGPPDRIKIGDLPTPAPAHAQVLVRTSFAAVNPIDTYVRSGAVPRNLPFPYIVGADLAGQVESVGPDVRGFAVGDRVWGNVWTRDTQQGSFAEYVCTDEKWLYPLPDGVRDADAAALALVGITAHLGLVREARLQPGEAVYVPGGSGGVGSAVIQMAKALGARVFTSAGSPAKQMICREFGADGVVDYRGDVSTQLHALVPQGIDVWFELLREPDLDLSVGQLREGGRLVVISGRAARPPLPLGPFYTKGCRLSGFQMTVASAQDRANCAADMNRWMAAGVLRARIDRVLPLAQAAEAHRLQEESTIGKSGGLAGKILIQIAKA